MGFTEKPDRKIVAPKESPFKADPVREPKKDLPNIQPSQPERKEPEKVPA